MSEINISQEEIQNALTESHWSRGCGECRSHALGLNSVILQIVVNLVVGIIGFQAGLNGAVIAIAIFITVIVVALIVLLFCILRAPYQQRNELRIAYRLKGLEIAQLETEQSEAISILESRLQRSGSQLKGRITSCQIDYGDNDLLLIKVDLEIKNLGPPSVAKDFKGTAVVDGKRYELVTFRRQGLVRFGESQSSGSGQFQDTTMTPIQQGEVLQGHIFFKEHSQGKQTVSKEQMQDPNTMLYFTFVATDGKVNTLESAAWCRSH